MKRFVPLLAFGAMLAFPCGKALAVDAKVATINPSQNLILVTIRGTAVTTEVLSSDKIAFPQFNFDGTKVACWRSSGGTWYLSVMDLSTRTFTNLLDISTWSAELTRSPYIRWPAGPWIYFDRPDASTDDLGTGEIWRVNSADPSKKELVVDYTPVNLTYTNWDKGFNVEKWYVTPDLRMAMIHISDGTTNWLPPKGLWVHYFPPARSDASAGETKVFVLGNCNPCLSPTGGLCGRFTNGGHEAISIYEWNAAQQTFRAMTTLPSENGSAISSINLESWSDAIDWAGVMWWPDWAVNSDKWISMNVEHPAGGDNTVVYSWKDKVAINATNNTTGSAVSRGIPAHSMFVEGGPAGSCEDIDGNWAAMPAVEVVPSVSATGANPYQVTLGTLPAGADLYYTTDGSEPTQSSTHYTGPFDVSVPLDNPLTMVKAKAFAGGNPTSNSSRYWLFPYLNQGTGLTCELWKNIPSGKVDNLTSSPRYPNSPDEEWLALLLAPQYGGWWTQKANWDTAFGCRISGYFVPPMSGDYQFVLHDFTEQRLRLSTSSDPADAIEIATILNSPWSYFPPPVDSSARIRLQAGQRYYIEHLSVPMAPNGSVWSVDMLCPWNATESPVPGIRFMPRDQVSIAIPAKPSLREVIKSDRMMVAIYDALGNLIDRYSGPLQNMRRPAGIYFVKISDGRRDVARRMVIGDRNGVMVPPR